MNEESPNAETPSNGECTISHEAVEARGKGGAPEAREDAECPTHSFEPDDAAPLDPKRCKRAIDDLTRAEILDDSTHHAVRELMVRAYVETKGVPARIVNAGEGSAPLPDLTATDSGRALLDRLDQFVRDRVKTRNEPDRETSGPFGVEHDGGTPPVDEPTTRLRRLKVRFAAAVSALRR